MARWAKTGFGAVLCVALIGGQPSTVLSRARELVKAGRVAEAERTLAAAIAAGEDTAELHGELGDLRYQSGQFRDAVMELGRAAQLDPDSTIYSMKLAGAIIADGRYPVALEFLKAVSARFENLPEYQYNAGLSYFGMHDYQNAARALRRAIELAPKMDLAHFFLGNTYAMGGELTTAVPEYREALRLNPKSAAYSFALGKVLGHMEQDQEPEAIRLLRKALELKPGDVASEYELGRICERADDLDCARPLLEDVSVRYPDLLAAHYALARVYRKLQLPEKAAVETGHVRRIMASTPRKPLVEAIADSAKDLPVPTPAPDRP